MFKVHKYFKKKAGWTQKNLAELFDVSQAQISIILRGAKDIEAGYTVDDQKESHLQNRIYNQWHDLFKVWKLLDQTNQGKYNTNEIGEIDFLAKHKTDEERYLVIELKKGGLSDSAVGQILRYMGWVKINLAKEKGKVQGIIIVGENIQEKRYNSYVLIHMTNIELKYWMFKNDQLAILCPDEYFKDENCANRLLKKLSPDLINRVINELKGKNS